MRLWFKSPTIIQAPSPPPAPNPSPTMATRAAGQRQRRIKEKQAEEMRAYQQVEHER